MKIYFIAPSIVIGICWLFVYMLMSVRVPNDKLFESIWAAKGFHIEKEFMEFFDDGSLSQYEYWKFNKIVEKAKAKKFLSE